MAENKVHIRIITPEEVKVDETADLVIMRCTTGDMGVLPGHEPRSAVLDYGVLRILKGEEERRIAVFGGLAEVKNDKVTILANAAEWPEDIDRARAEAEREQTEQRLLQSQDALAIKRDQAMLRRTLVQIEVSSYPFINKPPKEEKKE